VPGGDHGHDLGLARGQSAGWLAASDAAILLARSVRCGALHAPSGC
jgi:hypothetical protein